MKSEKLQKTLCCAYGEKVFIEPFTLKRLAEFYALYQVSRYKWERFITLFFRSPLDAGAYLNQQVQNDHFTGFFVVEKKTDKLVGFILGDELSTEEVSLTRAIGCQYERRGYAYEAKQLVEQLLKKAGYKYVGGICDASNTRSIELLCRGGYHLVHTQKIAVASVVLTLEFYRKCL